MGSATWLDIGQFEITRGDILEALLPFAEAYDLHFRVSSEHGDIPRTMFRGSPTDLSSRIVYLKFWCAPIDLDLDDESRELVASDASRMAYRFRHNDPIPQILGIPLVRGQQDAIPAAFRAIHGTPLIDSVLDVTYGTVFKNVIYIAFDLPHAPINVVLLINAIMPQAIDVLTKNLPDLMKGTHQTAYTRFKSNMLNFRVRAERAVLEAQARLRQNEEELKRQQDHLQMLEAEAKLSALPQITQAQYEAAIEKISTMWGVSKVEAEVNDGIVTVTTKAIYVEFERRLYKMGRIMFDIRPRLMLTQYAEGIIDNPVYVHRKITQGPAAHPHVDRHTGIPCMALKDVMWLRQLVIQGEFATLVDFMLRFFRTYTLGGAFTPIEQWALVKDTPKPVPPVECAAISVND